MKLRVLTYNIHRAIGLDRRFKPERIEQIISNHEPEHIADRIRFALSDPARLDKWKENLKFAASELVWEKEKLKLEHVLNNYGG